MWAEGGYAEKLGLPPVAQGTGMSTADAQALRLKDVALFRDYTQKVWASTEDFIAKTDPAALDVVITVKPLGDMPGIRALGQTCVSHGMAHAGEIELVRHARRVIAPVAARRRRLIDSKWREAT